MYLPENGQIILRQLTFVNESNAGKNSVFFGGFGRFFKKFIVFMGTPSLPKVTKLRTIYPGSIKQKTSATSLIR